MVPTTLLTVDAGNVIVHYPAKKQHHQYFDKLTPWDASWSSQYEVIVRCQCADYESAKNKLHRVCKDLEDSLSTTTDVDNEKDKRSRRDRAKVSKQGASKNCASKSVLAGSSDGDDEESPVAPSFQ